MWREDAAIWEIVAAADPAMTAPSLWELAVRAGAAAAGLSAYITRRSRNRRTEPDA